MPINQYIPKCRTIRATAPLVETPRINFNPAVAGAAIVEGLVYLKKQLDWSGTKVASILHLPANTVNTWLKNGVVPISSARLHPDIQAVIHLLAIQRNLEGMFENPLLQRAWLSTHHPELNEIPEKLMAESLDGLILVRHYLEDLRGRGA
jgi:hypothetical protein